MATSKKGKKETKVFTHICEYDQNVFTSSKPFARFCKQDCRVKYFREREAFANKNALNMKKMFRENAAKITKDMVADIKFMVNHSNENNLSGMLDKVSSYLQKGSDTLREEDGLTFVFNQYLREKHRKEKLKK